jgi:hypothetical protein
MDQELTLSPGEYTLTVEQSSSIRKQIKLFLETGATIQVSILFNSKTESLELKILE